MVTFHQKTEIKLNVLLGEEPWKWTHVSVFEWLMTDIEQQEDMEGFCD